MSKVINNSSRSDKDEKEERNERSRVGRGDSPCHTLTHSLTLSQIPSLTIINLIHHYTYNLGIQNYSLDCDDH